MIGDVLEELRREPEFAEWLGRHSRPQRLCAAGIARPWPGSACWALFAGRSATPVAIVKLARRTAYARRLRAEAEALRHLAHRREVADSVPRPLALLESGERVVFAQTGVRGTQMNMVVSRRWRTTARDGAADHDRVLDWLARLHAVEAPEQLRVDPRAVLDQLERLLQDARRGPTLSHVEALAQAWPEATLPLLPGHGDLTPANCFVDRRRLRVIDWEDGLRLRTPLADVVTFLVEYARWLRPSRRRPRSTPDALRAAFLADTWVARLTARTFRRYLAGLGLPPEAAEYLFIVTLAELAAGAAPVAHPARAARHWAEALRAYARDFEASVLRG